MPRLFKWLLLPALLALSCERGTEVGNPEITMAARFRLHDTAATASIPEMNLKVMGMGWTAGGDTGDCWNEPNGHMVDFAANDSSLPAVTVKNVDWSQAEMMLQAPAGDLSLPDTSSFADWSNPRYAKLVKVMSGDTLRFLFRMPDSLRIKLMFEKTTIKSWRHGRTMMVDISFDVGKWAAGLGSDPDFRFREDGKRVRYVLLSPSENAAVYGALMALLPEAFMADAVLML